MTSSLLLAYNWMKGLVTRFYQDQEKLLLIKEVEELKTSSQNSLEHIYSQEQKISELSTKLQLETRENTTLWDQIDYLTNELVSERQWRQQLETDLCGDTVNSKDPAWQTPRPCSI